MTDRPTLLTQVLTDYLALQQASRSDTLALFPQVLEAWNHATIEIAERNRSRGISFSPFTLIKIGETSHSRILGDLLNPRGSHGQGALLLKVFLEKLGYPEPESDGWQVTVETGRVDILIWRSHPERRAIIIENKSNNAGDQLNQIYRYWHREMYLWDRELWDATDELTTEKRSQRFHIVYLPTDGGKSPAEHSLQRPEGWTDADNPHSQVPLEVCKTVSLLELTQLWLNNAISDVPVTNTRLRDFLSQYQDLWKS